MNVTSPAAVYVHVTVTELLTLVDCCPGSPAFFRSMCTDMLRMLELQKAILCTLKHVLFLKGTGREGLKIVSWVCRNPYLALAESGAVSDSATWWQLVRLVLSHFLLALTPTSSGTHAHTHLLINQLRYI